MAIELACPGAKQAVTWQMVAGAATSSTPVTDIILSNTKESAAPMETVDSTVASNLFNFSTMTAGAVLRVEATSKGAANTAVYDMINAVSDLKIVESVNINIAGVSTVVASTETNSVLTGAELQVAPILCLS
jgi:hypothetical protein